MHHRLATFVAFLLLICTTLAYTIPPTGIRSVSEAMTDAGGPRKTVDGMIKQCFQTLCKEWMSECHWFCDSVKDQGQLRRCKDCLSWRGQQCMDCFEL